jgi:hypothetical protein
MKRREYKIDRKFNINKNKICIHHFEANIDGTNLQTKQRHCIHLRIEKIKDWVKERMEDTTEFE